MTQLCFELSVGFRLSTLIAKEWSQREMNWKWPSYLLPILHPSRSGFPTLMPLDVVT